MPWWAFSFKWVQYEHKWTFFSFHDVSLQIPTSSSSCFSLFSKFWAFLNRAVLLRCTRPCVWWSHSCLPLSTLFPQTSQTYWLHRSLSIDFLKVESWLNSVSVFRKDWRICVAGLTTCTSHDSSDLPSLVAPSLCVVHREAMSTAGAHLSITSRCLCVVTMSQE